MDNVTAELSVSVHQQSCQAAPSDFVEMTETLCSQLRPGKKQIYALYRNSSVILLLQNISTFFSGTLFVHLCRCPVLLSTSSELRKAAISFVMSVCQSVCLSARQHRTSRLPLDGFSWRFIFEHSSIICLENSRFIKI